MKLPKHKKPKTYNTEAKQELKLLSRLWKLRTFRYPLYALIIVILAPIVFFVLRRPTIHPNIKYGVNFSDKYARDIGLDWKQTYTAILDDLGAKNLRLVAYWDDIEATKDTYDFSIIKYQLDEVEKRNATAPEEEQINIILTVGRKVPRWPECFQPTWWHDEELRGQEIQQLEFVEKTVTELKNYKSIQMWQVENEPFFTFGHCNPPIARSILTREVKVVRALDNRPIVIQDSGEGGLWYPTYSLGDYLAISMYRKIWFDFWGILLGEFVYFKYPLAHWTYKIKADIVQVPANKIIVSELQAEPWGPVINSELTEEQKGKTMSRNDFIDTISYAQKAGFENIYFWGAEWWYWEKTQNGNGFYWDTAKALFKERTISATR